MIKQGFTCKRNKKHFLRSFFSLCIACALLFLQTQAVSADGWDITGGQVDGAGGMDNGLGIKSDDDGNITITMDAKTASSGITWATMGFYLSNERVAPKWVVDNVKRKENAVIS